MSELDLRAQLSRGAEHLVAADLSLAGLNCYLAAPGLCHDLVVDLWGCILRVQVKSTSSTRPFRKRANNVYVFEDNVSFNAYRGAADVFALVATDIRRVLYISADKITRRFVIKPETFEASSCASSLNNCFLQNGVGYGKEAQGG